MTRKTAGCETPVNRLVQRPEDDDAPALHLGAVAGFLRQNHPGFHRGQFRGKTVGRKTTVAFSVRISDRDWTGCSAGPLNMKKNVNPNLTISLHKQNCPDYAAAEAPKTLNGFGVAIFASQSPSATGAAAYGKAARVMAPDAAASLDYEATYKCRNCGRTLKLREAVNYYGIPACPVCVYAGQPFEIVEERSDSGSASDC
jgi:hypothetical protein